MLNQSIHPNSAQVDPKMELCDALTMATATPKKTRKRTPMSDEHKAALAKGREEGRIVRRYLEALESTQAPAWAQADAGVDHASAWPPSTPPWPTPTP